MKKYWIGGSGLEVSKVVELENRIKLLNSKNDGLRDKLDEVYKTINSRVNNAIARKREEIISNTKFELHQYYSHYMDENFNLKKEVSTLKKYIEAMEKCNIETGIIEKNNMDVIPVHSTTTALHDKCNFMTKDNDTIPISKSEETERCNFKTKSANSRNYKKNYETKAMLELYNNGYTFEQVAKEIGCSVRTVKHRFEMECDREGYKKYKMKGETV